MAGTGPNYVPIRLPAETGTGDPGRVTWVNLRLKRAAKAAGILEYDEDGIGRGKFWPHACTCRHTYATRKAQQGCPLPTLKELTSKPRWCT